jgi:hypothetical protein
MVTDNPLRYRIILLSYYYSSCRPSIRSGGPRRGSVGSSGNKSFIHWFIGLGCHREGVSVGQALLNATHFVRLSVPLGGDRYRYGQDEWWISGTRNNNEMCSARPGDAGAGSHRARGSELLLHHTQTVIEVRSGSRYSRVRVYMLRPVQSVLKSLRFYFLLCSL